MDIYLTPSPPRPRNRESSGPWILKFGTWTLALKLAVVFGGTGRMSPDAENPLKVSQIQYGSKFGFPNVTPEG